MATRNLLRLKGTNNEEEELGVVVAELAHNAYLFLEVKLFVCSGLCLSTFALHI